jgi:curved DNA-binding protein CbpA
MTSESPDYYELLQISRNATALIVTKAYRLLAALYHPDNKETGNEDAFRQLVEAHAVLADPVRRAVYDRERFGATTGSATHGEAPSDARGSDVLYRDERELRQLVLLTLYTARRNRPSNPAVPLMVLLELLGCSVDEVQFTLWYLRGKKFIETHDDGASITVAGVDHVEIVGEDRDGNALPPASRRPMLEAHS